MALPDTWQKPSADDIDPDSLEYLFGPKGRREAPWVRIVGETEPPIPRIRPEMIRLQARVETLIAQIEIYTNKLSKANIELGYARAQIAEKDRQLELQAEYRARAALAIGYDVDRARMRERIAELERQLNYVLAVATATEPGYGTGGREPADRAPSFAAAQEPAVFSFAIGGREPAEHGPDFARSWALSFGTGGQAPIAAGTPGQAPIAAAVGGQESFTLCSGGREPALRPADFGVEKRAQPVLVPRQKTHISRRPAAAPGDNAPIFEIASPQPEFDNALPSFPKHNVGLERALDRIAGEAPGQFVFRFPTDTLMYFLVIAVAMLVLAEAVIRL